MGALLVAAVKTPRCGMSNWGATVCHKHMHKVLKMEWTDIWNNKELVEFTLVTQNNESVGGSGVTPKEEEIGTWHSMVNVLTSTNNRLAKLTLF